MHLGLVFTEFSETYLAFNCKCTVKTGAFASGNKAKYDSSNGTETIKLWPQKPNQLQKMFCRAEVHHTLCGFIIRIESFDPLLI